MVVGDSISHGSAGDYTWRYRLWKHLTGNGVAVDFVGPRRGLFDSVRSPSGEVIDTNTYADRAFDSDHNAGERGPRPLVMLAQGAEPAETPRCGGCAAAGSLVWLLATAFGRSGRLRGLIPGGVPMPISAARG